MASLAVMLIHPRQSALDDLYVEFMSARDVTAQPETEDWFALVRRLSVPGRIHEITGDVYRYFLHLQPTFSRCVRVLKLN